MSAPGPGDRSTVGVTIMFTDLVGSTELAARHSAIGAESIRRVHFDLLRRALGQHDGVEVKNLGDGVMVAFASIGDALDTAVTIQQSFHQLNATSGGDPLHIRVGIATGDCTIESGDYFGEPVVQAARLCARADGQQILTHEVVRLIAPRGAHQFEPVGALELKGLPEPINTFRVVWEPVADEPRPQVPLPARLGLGQHLAYVGRDAERDQMRRQLTAATNGERQVVLVSGEAGLGKTRLAAELARTAHAEASLVLYGACSEELSVPYRPWAEALGHWARNADGASPAHLSSEARLAALLPEILDAAIPPTDDRDAPTTDQYALYAATTRLLNELCQSHSSVLIVLDDLHWTDLSSLHLLRHVVAQVHSEPLMIIGTYRETDIDESHPLSATLAALRREPAVTRVGLAGLSSEDIVSMLEASTDRPAVQVDRFAQLLQAETAGNPFFLGELLRHLDESADARTLEQHDADGIGLPGSLREVVNARVRRLGDGAVRVLTTAAVIGRAFDLGLLGMASDLDDDAVLDLLEPALAAGILDEVPGVADRFEFTHALVGRTLRDSLSTSRRSRLHRRIAELMESMPDSGRRPAELTTHWLAAGVEDQRDHVRALAVAAGDDARSRRAPDDASGWFRRALALTDGGEDRCEILVRLGDAQRHAGDPEHRRTLLEAADLAGRLGRSDLLVDAALANTRGFQSAAGEVDAERIGVLRSALDALGADDRPERGLLLAMLASELTFTDDSHRFDLAREGVAVARRTGDDGAVVDAINYALVVLVGPEHFDEAAELSAQAMHLTDGSADPNRRIQALFGAQAVHLMSGSIDEADACRAEYDELAGQLGQPLRLWTGALRSAIAATLAGDYTRAEAWMDETLERGLATGQPDALVSYGALLMGLRIHQGRSGEMIDLLSRAVETNPGLPILRAALVNFLATEGEVELARGEFDGLGELDQTIARNHFWLASMVFLSETAPLLDRPGVAAQLYDWLRPHEHRVAVHPAGCLGSVSLSLGTLANALGRADDAERHLRDSLELHERLRSPYFVARSATELGLLLQGADHRAERDELLGRAIELSNTHGFSAILRRLGTTSDTA